MGHHWSGVTVSPQPFYKMSGSGNDFVFFDAREGMSEEWRTPQSIQRVSSRGAGVGADGVVFLEPPEQGGSIRMRYFNSDGSLASLCGNATLCTARLATLLGAADVDRIAIETDTGVLKARIVEGQPEFDLAPVTLVETTVSRIPIRAGERRIGYAVAGVPHLVVVDDNTDLVDLPVRGKELRWHRAVQPEGANVNFVGRRIDGSWSMRTYERGVEGETLACGSGAVAVAILLVAWELAESPVELTTRSGQILRVAVRQSGGEWTPSLRGEGRLVFRGELG